jgi:hypothetical protein
MVPAEIFADKDLSSQVGKIFCNPTAQELGTAYFQYFVALTKMQKSKMDAAQMIKALNSLSEEFKVKDLRRRLLNLYVTKGLSEADILAIPREKVDGAFYDRAIDTMLDKCSSSKERPSRELKESFHGYLILVDDLSRTLSP